MHRRRRTLLAINLFALAFSSSCTICVTAQLTFRIRACTRLYQMVLNNSSTGGAERENEIRTRLAHDQRYSLLGKEEKAEAINFIHITSSASVDGEVPALHTCARDVLFTFILLLQIVVVFVFVVVVDDVEQMRICL